LVHCFFLRYINDLPKVINDNSKIVLFAYDTSIIITSPNPINFKSGVNKILKDINRWFTTNLLTQNVDKTHHMQFVTETNFLIGLNITHGNKEIVNICNTKFLRLTLDDTFSLKIHIDTIVPIISSTCLRLEQLSHSYPKMVYYSYFHSIMTNGLIFWGNFYYSNIIFRLQKISIRTIVRIRDRNLCRKHFRKLKVSPLQSQYTRILSPVK
jgi:hypothetical protein